MKKIISYMMLVMMLTFVGPKPADALILDPAALAGKISEWVGKVTDAVTKITQQISQIKQTATQGFSKAELFSKGKEYLGKYGLDKLNIKKLSAKNKKALVEDTKEKEKDQLESDKEFYQETSQKYYESKKNVLKDNMTELETNLKSTKLELNTKENELRVKESQYKTLKAQEADERTIDKARDEYEEVAAEVETLKLKKEELEENIDTLEKDQKLLDEEASKIGTSADPEYKAYEDRIKALEASQDIEVEVGAQNLKEDDEWDSEGIMASFTLSDEEYKNFIKKYFYSEFNISGDVDKLAYQTEMDKVMRSRRQLVVNSAVHLLQVTATIRRELPERSNIIKEMFDGVRSTDSEFQAIGYYSGTKVENIRALLLYARLQSARLQYMAAKDLLIIEPRRRGNPGDETNSGFDLGKYKLTDSYVKAIEDEANKKIDAFAEVK